MLTLKVASAPTAELGASTVLVKRTTIGDHARGCYSGVQVHYDNISTSPLPLQILLPSAHHSFYADNHIHDHGGIITVDVSSELHSFNSKLRRKGCRNYPRRARCNPRTYRHLGCTDYGKCPCPSRHPRQCSCFRRHSHPFNDPT